MSEAAEPATENQGDDLSAAETGKSTTESKVFSQEEVDKLIGSTRSDERRKAQNIIASKYADYDDLKKAAEGKKTADDRIAELEQKYQQSESKAMRLRVAADYGISTKSADDGGPSDADLFLTGTDEETLTAQAKRLADRVAAQAAAEVDRKKKNPMVSKEGTSTKTGTTTEEDDREFARTFFSGGSS